MSNLSIAHYFPFPRVRILKQRVSEDAESAWIEVAPDKRFHPICHICGSKGVGVHSQEQRSLRDLNFASARVWIQCHYRKTFAPHANAFPSRASICSIPTFE